MILISISLNPTTDCVSYLGLPNSLFNTIWLYTSESIKLPMQYLMYHVNEQHCREMNNCSFFIWSFVIFYAVHMNFKTNQNWSMSSFPNPLKTSNFIVFDILNNGRGASGVGKGVCYGGEGGGGVGRWGIHRSHCLINWTMLYGEACAAPLSLLRGGSINRLYLGPVLPISLKNLPLPIAPNIKVMA